MSADYRTLTMRSERMPVGEGFAVTFVMERGALDCEWHPSAPRGRGSPAILAAYRLARNEFLARVAKRIGGNVMVAEL